MTDKIPANVEDQNDDAIAQNQKCLCGCNKLKWQCKELLAQKQGQKAEGQKEITEEGNDDAYILYTEVDTKTIQEYVKKLKALKCANFLKNQYETQAKKAVRKKYFQFGLIANLSICTTDCDLNRLIKFDFRTFVVQNVYYTNDELNQILLKLNTAIAVHEMENIYRAPIGLAVEICGDATRIGRIRNNAAEKLFNGHVVVLTTNTEYRYCSQKEILYVYNLWRVLKCIKVNDIIIIEPDIHLRVTKVLIQTVSVCVEKGGDIESFANILIPYSTPYEISEFDCEDILFAVNNNAHFLIIPNITNLEMIIRLKEFCLKQFCHQFKIIGKLNLMELNDKPCLLCDIVQECDGIWIDDFLVRAKNGKIYFNTLTMNLNKIAHEYDKPLIGTVPIKTRCDFNKLENTIVLHELDSFLIEKSEKTNTYPIICSILMPLPKKFEAKPTERLETSQCHKDSGEIALVNCINYTINSINCSGIVLSSLEKNDVCTKLAHCKIYCPVIIVLNDPDTAKSLNIRKNLKTILYTAKSTENAEKECIDYGIQYGRDTKIFSLGDFVLTFWETIVYNILGSKLKAMYIPEEKIYVKQKIINPKTKEDFFELCEQYFFK